MREGLGIAFRDVEPSAPQSMQPCWGRGRTSANYLALTTTLSE